MAGLIGVGRGYANQAGDSFSRLADMERQRNQANQQIEQQEKAGMMSAIGTGAGIGMMAGGPVGGLIGAGVGLLAGGLF